MVRYTAAAALAAVFSFAAAQSQNPTCGANNLCPESAPCCSAYGQCGVGAYCLGGCDPKYSHSLNSCLPAPVCKSQKWDFKDLKGVQDISKYLGDPATADWVSSGKPAPYNGGMLMTMAQDTVGTLVASSHYVWYGKISAKMITSGGKGVVTAFIMMSDVKDEIDFEWVGAAVDKAQSNYYHQGVTVYTNSANLSTSDTSKNEHTYTIDWKPDSIQWAIDGQVMRTVNKKDTYNDTAKEFYYPQTPARVMLSLWPAGLPSNAKGTVDWAGGVIDWNSPYMQNGYYYAQISEVSVECYDPPGSAKKEGDKTYTYNNGKATEDTVVIGNKQVKLASLYASGENPNFDPNAKASSAGSKPTQSALPESIPGQSGAGTRSDEGTHNTNGQQGGSGGSGGNNGGETGGSIGGGSGGNGFSQNVPGGNTGGATTQAQLGGSIFAVWIAMLGLLLL